eukprot:TRINITY_DN26581_c0_g2_i1.p1 TRINITY_DN26581_c0_g2~~TRINITY_DN26581_c0_g2_i1.p1  ORF type:complete len:322 (+),score=50.59 TRINITY_DN26581_c0_g2_i1:86-967(+)
MDGIKNAPRNVLAGVRALRVRAFHGVLAVGAIADEAFTNVQQGLTSAWLAIAKMETKVVNQADEVRHQIYLRALAARRAVVAAAKRSSERASTLLRQSVASAWQRVPPRAQASLSGVAAAAGARLAVAREVAKEPRTKVAAASAAGGAVTLGASGGLAGLATGTIAGAAAGLIPAVFTLGLSIPLGAVLGGGSGLVIGTTVGGAAGLVGGGVAGSCAYARRDSIQSSLSRAGECVDYVKGSAEAGLKRTASRASECAEFVKEKAEALQSQVRARVVGGATGGTETASTSDATE